MDVSKRSIFRAFKFSGLNISKDAIQAMFSVLRHEDDPQHVLKECISAIKARLERDDSASAVVSRGVVEAVIEDLAKDDDDRAFESLSVVSAFDLPLFRLNAVRKTFYLVDAGKRKLHGDASDRASMLRDRFQIMQHRMLRNALFSKSEFSSALQFGGKGGVSSSSPSGSTSGRGGQKVEVTPIDSLVGTAGTKILLGLLSQRADGRYWLEDLNGSVRADLSNARTTVGFFTLGCIVLAEGEMVDDDEEGDVGAGGGGGGGADGRVFRVSCLGFPPAEARRDTLRSICSSIHTGVEGILGYSPQEESNLLALEEGDEETVFCVLSDVHLDRCVWVVCCSATFTFLSFTLLSSPLLFSPLLSFTLLFSALPYS